MYPNIIKTKNPEKGFRLFLSCIFGAGKEAYCTILGEGKEAYCTKTGAGKDAECTTLMFQAGTAENVSLS